MHVKQLLVGITKIITQDMSISLADREFSHGSVLVKMAYLKLSFSTSHPFKTSTIHSK